MQSVFRTVHSSLYKRPKKAIFPSFFHDFFGRFSNIWPLAGPNIAEKGWPLLGKALDGFGVGLEAANFGNAGFWRLKAPETRISGA